MLKPQGITLQLSAFVPLIKEAAEIKKVPKE